MWGIEQENICRIQWDDCFRYKIPNKIPWFSHFLSPCVLSNLNVGLVATLFVSNALALSSEIGGVGGTTGIVCYISNCLARTEPDASCDGICSWCSGNATTPTGYVNNALGLTTTTITRGVSTECNNDGMTYSCSCSEKSGTNVELNSLACDVGYYGNPSYSYSERYGDYFSGCYRCPSSNGVYGTTATVGGTSVAECYLPSGNTFSDETGSGTYSNNCYYSS